MDAIPIEIVHIIYSCLFFPTDIIRFMLTCRKYSYLPLDTKQLLNTWKCRYNCNKNISLIKQFIVTDDLHTTIESSLRITNKLTFYRYSHYYSLYGKHSFIYSSHVLASLPMNII